jgi:LmbE family N-acetylglucosaminyl deacetylase
MTPYHKLVQDFARLVQDGTSLPLGNFATPERAAPAEDARKTLIFSPHPDDECIIGGLALRMMKECGMRVVNVAVTQGSDKERQGARLEELRGACDYLGFGLETIGDCGLEQVKTSIRDQQPEQWAASVKHIADVLAEHAPHTILFPHDSDWNSTHIGVHFLVLDALRSLGDAFECNLVETEFWGAMDDPNLMVEIGEEDLGDLLTALTFHVGEVNRNPYHLLTPAWMQDNVRRGGELVCGQGGAPPDFAFATCYRLRRWTAGEARTFFEGGRILGVGNSPMSLFAG